MLDDVPATQVTQVVAPVGAGKSTLVASWADRRGVRWLRADQHHRLLEQVLDHHGVGPTALDEDAALSALQDIGPGQAPAVVVIDDAHQMSKEARRVLTRLVTEAPRAASAVLVGRREVPLPDLPLGFGVSTAMVRGDDLRFTDEEAETLVLTMAPTVDDEELSRIVGEGRGWAAALVVGAREGNVASGTPGLAAVSADSHLLTRVLSTVTARVGALLLATCDEEVLEASTAEALTGDPSAGRLLELLASEGLLVENGSLGADGQPLFRLHPILRRALQEGSRPCDRGHDARVDAHRRAATTLASGDDPGLVVRHAILAEDPQVVLGALRTCGQMLLAPKKLDVLQGALDALPPRLRSSEPSAPALDSVLCRLTMRYDAACELSSAAELAADNAPLGEPDEQTMDVIALMRLWRSRCGWADPHLAVSAARDRLGCDHDSDLTHGVGPGRSLMWSTWLLSELAAVEIITGELDQAGIHLSEVIYNGRALGDGRLMAGGLAHRSLLELADGSFQTAAATARRSLEHAAEYGEGSLPFIARAHVVIGWAAVHELDLAAAQDHLA